MESVQIEIIKAHKDGVNVRLEPDKTSEIVSTIHVGDVIPMFLEIDTPFGWLYIESQNKRGYVYKPVIKYEIQEDDIPQKPLEFNYVPLPELAMSRETALTVAAILHWLADIIENWYKEGVD